MFVLLYRVKRLRTEQFNCIHLSVYRAVNGSIQGEHKLEFQQTYYTSKLSNDCVTRKNVYFSSALSERHTLHNKENCCNI